MGDRGNIVIDGKIWLYTHWSGSDLPRTLAAALVRGKPRWDDRPYLTRIIFCEMVKDEIDGETGYGIDYEYGDGGTDLMIDSEKQTVMFEKDTLGFADFIAKYGKKV